MRVWSASSIHVKDTAVGNPPALTPTKQRRKHGYNDVDTKKTPVRNNLLRLLTGFTVDLATIIKSFFSVMSVEVQITYTKYVVRKLYIYIYIFNAQVMH